MIFLIICLLTRRLVFGAKMLKYITPFCGHPIQYLKKVDISSEMGAINNEG